MHQRDAEGEGFEPPDLLQSTVFKTAAFDHSAILPGAKLDKQLNIQKVFFSNCIINLKSTANKNVKARYWPYFARKKKEIINFTHSCVFLSG